MNTCKCLSCLFFGLESGRGRSTAVARSGWMPSDRPYPPRQRAKGTDDRPV